MRGPIRATSDFAIQLDVIAASQALGYIFHGAAEQFYIETQIRTGGLAVPRAPFALGEELAHHCGPPVLS